MPFQRKLPFDDKRPGTIRYARLWDGSDYLYTLCFIKHKSVKVKSKVSEPRQEFA
jgi:hypothetical protein